MAELEDITVSSSDDDDDNFWSKMKSNGHAESANPSNIPGLMQVLVQESSKGRQSKVNQHTDLQSREQRHGDLRRSKTMPSNRKRPLRRQWQRSIQENTRAMVAARRKQISTADVNGANCSVLSRSKSVGCDVLQPPGNLRRIEERKPAKPRRKPIWQRLCVCNFSMCLVGRLDEENSAIPLVPPPSSVQSN